MKIPTRPLSERVLAIEDYVERLVASDPKNQDLLELRKQLSSLRRSMRIPANNPMGR